MENLSFTDKASAQTSKTVLTRITYLYCDASNYKFRGELLVDGVINVADLSPHLIDNEFFIPHEIGLAHLLNLPMNNDDHYLHTFEDFQRTNKGVPTMTSTELLRRVQIAESNGWHARLYFG